LPRPPNRSTGSSPTSPGWVSGARNVTAASSSAGQARQSQEPASADITSSARSDGRPPLSSVAAEEGPLSAFTTIHDKTRREEAAWRYYRCLTDRDFARRVLPVRLVHGNQPPHRTSGAQRPPSQPRHRAHAQQDQSCSRGGSSACKMVRRWPDLRSGGHCSPALHGGTAAEEMS
jgi:hypothetical protein